MKFALLNNKISVINYEKLDCGSSLDPFVTTEQYGEIKCNIKVQELSEAVYGIQRIENPGQIQNVFFSQKDYKQVLCSLDKEYTEFLISTKEICKEDVFMELLMVAFYSYMSLHNALLLHASVVTYENQGIVFTAASGVGKTTQAELWAKYKNAKILNGDKVFLKQEKDGIHAWGSPWKGSSTYACNESAKLRAIVVLEQAEANSIQKLEGLDVLEYVVPHVFFPSWDTNCEQAVLTFLDKVLEETDVYLLKCRPDEEAVELLAATIKE